MNEEEISAGLQRLGKRLAELLDEDQFAECEALLLAAAPKADVQEPVATVTIQHFRQDPRMENVDFQLQVTLPQGTHKLYAAPQPVSDDAKDALVEGLETIALESTDEQARCCAHHYLAAYRAAKEKKV